jgi:hypothetical protein
MSDRMVAVILTKTEIHVLLDVLDYWQEKLAVHSADTIAEVIEKLIIARRELNSADYR